MISLKYAKTVKSLKPELKYLCVNFIRIDLSNIFFLILKSKELIPKKISYNKNKKLSKKLDNFGKRYIKI